MGRPKKKTDAIEEVSNVTRDFPERNKEYMKYIADTELFKQKIVEYFSNCTENQKFPTFAGLRLYLGITVTELDVLLKSKASAELYRILEMSKDMRDECLSDIMLMNPKLAGTCMTMMSKTWFDNEQENKLEIVLNVTGLTDDPRDFKMI